MSIIKRSKSIKEFFVNFVILTSIFPLLFLGTVTIFTSGQTLKKEITDANSEQLDIITDTIEQYVSDSIEELTSIKYILENGQNISQDHFNLMLESMTVSHNHTMSMQIADHKGIILNAYPFDETLIGTDISGYQYFKEAQKSESSYWSPSFIPEQLDFPVTSISIMWKGGIVTAYQSLKNLKSAVSHTIDVNSERLITITDQNGVYIAHPSEEKIALRENDIYFRYFKDKWNNIPISEEIEYNGELHLAFVSMISNVGWKVALYQPTSIITKPVYTMSFWILLLTGFVLIIAAYLAKRLISGITDSLGNLVTTAKFIANGKYETHLSEMRYIEFNEFSQSLIKMSSEIHKREMELKDSEQMQKNIINSITSNLVGIDGEGMITLWNQNAEKTTDVKSSDAIGRPLWRIYPRLTEQKDDILNAISENKYIHDKKLSYEMEGEHYYETVSVYPLTGEMKGAVIRIDDVTERIRIEEMMIQNEKMLSVGGLAAGMAHEINNPLAGLLQTASVMGNRLNDDKDLPVNVKAAEEAGTTLQSIKRFMDLRDIPKMLQSISNSGKRVSDIVDNMLSFARKSDNRKMSYNMGELIDKTLYLAESDYDLKNDYDFKTIEIIKKYDNSLPPVHCESSKIQQVLLNIFRNGAQAMHDAKTAHPQFIIKTKRDQTGSDVSIEISDNGPGMTKEVQKRIFEPFYTTKPVGVGTGLGLSVSYFIITEDHNGKMSVLSNAGEGTKFTISLPM